MALSDELRVGHCWEVSGTSLQLGIRLPKMLRPSHISIDHIPRELAIESGRAPRLVRLWGAVDGPSNAQLSRDVIEQRHATSSVISNATGPRMTGGQTYLLLAGAEYDIHGPSRTQTFPVYPDIVASKVDFGVVVVEVASNWGSNTTCLYRVRIHGEQS